MKKLGTPPFPKELLLLLLLLLLLWTATGPNVVDDFVDDDVDDPLATP